MDGKRKKISTPKVLSGARRRHTKTKAVAVEEPESHLTLNNEQDFEYGNTETQTASGVGKEQIGESAAGALHSQEIQEETASIKKQSGRITLRTAEKRASSKRKLGANATSTPTPKRGRPRKLDVEGIMYRYYT